MASKSDSSSIRTVEGSDEDNAVETVLKKEVETLKRKIEEQEEEFRVSSKKVNSEHKIVVNELESKMAKQFNFSEKLKSKVECPVCMEVPRSGPVPVCPNGHFVCKTCKTASCPTCRTDMGGGKSFLAKFVLEHIEHKCKFAECDAQFPLDSVEDHEKTCPHRTVSCPYIACTFKVALSKLVDHLVESETCCFDKSLPTLTLFDAPENFLIKKKYILGTALVAAEDMSWKIRIFSAFGEMFAIFPWKSNRMFYMGMVMFSSEEECSKFNVKMKVQEVNDQDEDSLKSDLSLKFSGRPFSVDAEKEGWKLFGITEQFMVKIFQKNTDDVDFSVSYNISKIQ